MSARSNRLARPGQSPRRYRRFEVDGVELRSGLIEANLVDVSELGAGIEASEPPRIGAPFFFEVKDGKKATRLEGEICWCSLAGTRRAEGNGDILPVYRAGIRFTNGSTKDFSLIMKNLGLLEVIEKE